MSRSPDGRANATGAAPQLKRRIDDIRVLERYRKDMGDIAGLARTIEDVGLLHPIVVTPAGILIVGERRLEACRWLGHEEIPVTIVDIDRIARGEAAENFFRKDFALSEAVAIKRALEPAIKEAAKARMTHGGRGKRGGKLPPDSVGKARDQVAMFTGRKARTLEKAEAIIMAAEAEPERFGKLVKDMDRTGHADGPFKRLKMMQQAEAIRRKPPPLPGNGPYRVIVVDPPWESFSPPYPTKSNGEIAALNVGSIAAEDCILWLWVTEAQLIEAAHIPILEVWGFRPKKILVWEKISRDGTVRFGKGGWLRNAAEFCVLAVRGNPVFQGADQATVQRWPAQPHSRKPDEFFAWVERVCPAPRNAYCELFARRRRPGWDAHGDEVPQPGEAGGRQRRGAIRADQRPEG